MVEDTQASRPLHIHEWRADSDAFTSWRDCLACGKREWFMEVDLP